MPSERTLRGVNVANTRGETRYIESPDATSSFTLCSVRSWSVRAAISTGTPGSEWNANRKLSRYELSRRSCWPRGGDHIDKISCSLTYLPRKCAFSCRIASNVSERLPPPRNLNRTAVGRRNRERVTWPHTKISCSEWSQIRKIRTAPNNRLATRSSAVSYSTGELSLWSGYNFGKSPH